MFLLFTILLLSFHVKLIVSRDNLFNITEDNNGVSNNSVCLVKFIYSQLPSFKTILVINYVKERTIQWPNTLEILRSDLKWSFITFNLNFQQYDLKMTISKTFMNYLLQIQDAAEAKDAVYIMELISVYSPLSKILVILDESVSIVNENDVKGFVEFFLKKSLINIYVIVHSQNAMNLWYPKHFLYRNSSLEIVSLCSYSFNSSGSRFQSQGLLTLYNEYSLRVAAELWEPFVYKQKSPATKGIEIRLLEVIAQKTKTNVNVDFFSVRHDRPSNSKIFLDLIEGYV